MKNITKIISNVKDWHHENKSLRKKVELFTPSLGCKITYLVIMGPCVIFFLIVIIIGKMSWSENIFVNIIVSLLLLTIFVIYPIVDILGRNVVLNSDKISQRKMFISSDNVPINSIIKCSIKTGIDSSKKQGYATLCILHKSGHIDINMFYYSKDDLVILLELIGLNNIFK